MRILIDTNVLVTTALKDRTTVSFPRNQRDAKFLACALAAQADSFITSDKDFTDAMELVSTKILEVSRFKKLLIGTDNK